MFGTGLDLSVASQGSRDSVVDTDEVDLAANVSQTNKQLDETTVTPTQVVSLILKTFNSSSILGNGEQSRIQSELEYWRRY